MIYFLLGAIWVLGMVVIINLSKKIDAPKTKPAWPVSERTDRDNILDEIALEAQQAADKFAPFNSAHEGFAVLLEEVDELKAEVWKNPSRNPDRAEKMRKEAIQVGAMALRFLTDVCETKKT